MNAALLAQDAEHAASTAGDGGALAEWAWLIVVVPLVATVLITLVGKRMPLKGWELAVGAVGFVAVYGVILFFANMDEGIVFEDSVEIARFDTFAIEWGWVVDGLSIMMYALIGVVALFVFIYAKGYMEGDARYTFFFAAFTLFAGSMLVLVSAPNLVQLLVGWELVGVCSYLLIGHWWEQHENSSSAIKAFLTNKIADVGLVLGIIVVGVTVGSTRFAAIEEAVLGGDSALADVAVVAAVLLFIGAMGKSAQVPFHVWLPDAMAGPTPVSSLMHAATMVTAGVYLLGRMFPLYSEMATDVQTLVVVVGVVTLFGVGLLAMVQDDIKKVLAYSTVSQLGYMVAAMGIGAYTAGLFHLFTHAFFKGLLFLCAGSIIHAVHSNNMSDMGGLRKHMPVTFWTFIIGALALMGIFPLAGFFSKDEILAAMDFEGYTAAWAISLAGAFITAFYMTRAIFLTFFGKYKGDSVPHESPAIMTFPLIGLAVLTVVSGWVNVPGLFTGFTDWVGTRAAPIVEHHAEEFEFGLAAISLGVALLGIAVAWRFFYPEAPTQLERDRVYIPGLYPLLRNKYYLDDIYFYGLIKPVRDPLARWVDWTNSYIIDWVVNSAGFASRGVARVVYQDLDQRGIDLAINAGGAAAGQAGTALRYTQTGKVQQYAAGLFVGVVLLIVGFIIFA